MIFFILNVHIDSILKRDCYDSLSSNEVQDCESSAEIKCHHCTEAFCNKGHPKHKCVECDSKTDANCMTNATKFAVDQCIYDSNELDDFYCYTKYVSIVVFLYQINFLIASKRKIVNL